MGLSAYPQIREWIRNNAESAVILPQNIRPIRAESVVLIDATQQMRYSPRGLTGRGFCEWFWRSISSLPSKYYVVSMDKTSFVPPEKAATQSSRDTDESYSERSEFSAFGVRHSPSMAWKTFSGMEAVSCREVRGKLMQLLYSHARSNPPALAPDVLVVLDYEYPKGEPKTVQIGPGGQIGDFEHKECSLRVGESDVSQLAWVNVFREFDDIISLQIDSDLLCIAMLYLLRTPKKFHPKKWTWVAGLSSWLDQPVLATEEITDGFRLFHPTPAATRKRKGPPEQPWFCVDLLELYDRIRTDAGSFPRIKDMDDRVRCWVMICVLQNTDYYTSKNKISHRFGFHIVFGALQRSWVEYWKPLWRWWGEMGVWSFDRMTTDQQKANDMIALLPPEAFRVLVRWQLQLLWWEKNDDKDNPALQPDLLSRLQYKFEESKRSLTQYCLPSDDDIVRAHQQAWFNCMYWSRPFL